MNTHLHTHTHALTHIRRCVLMLLFMICFTCGILIYNDEIMEISFDAFYVILFLVPLFLSFPVFLSLSLFASLLGC